MEKTNNGRFADENKVYAIILEELHKVAFQHETDILIRAFWNELKQAWDVTAYREMPSQQGWCFTELNQAYCYGDAMDAILFFNENGVKNGS